jgi:NADH:ubiquinone reductase (H+-translocating)
VGTDLRNNPQGEAILAVNLKFSGRALLQPKRPRVVIVGCGFGGLWAARALKHAPVDVLLIDRNNYHLFQPLLYQVASAALGPADIAQPIRLILRSQRNALVMLAEVTRIDTAGQCVYAGQHPVPYDYLLVARLARWTIISGTPNGTNMPPE